MVPVIRRDAMLDPSVSAEDTHHDSVRFARSGIRIDSATGVANGFAMTLTATHRTQE